MTDCLIKTKITEELKYLSWMINVIRKVVVFSEFSFWFSFNYPTRIPARVETSAVKLHGLFQFELKIYSCEMSYNESGLKGRNKDKVC